MRGGRAQRSRAGESTPQSLFDQGSSLRIYPFMSGRAWMVCTSMIS